MIRPRPPRLSPRQRALAQAALECRAIARLFYAAAEAAGDPASKRHKLARAAGAAACLRAIAGLAAPASTTRQAR